MMLPGPPILLSALMLLGVAPGAPAQPDWRTQPSDRTLTAGSAGPEGAPTGTGTPITPEQEGTGTSIKSILAGTLTHNPTKPIRTGTHVPSEQGRTGTHAPSDPGRTGTHIPSEPVGTGTHIPANPIRSATHILSEPGETGTHILTEPGGTGTHISSESIGTETHSPPEPERTGTHVPSELGRTETHIPSEVGGTGTHIPSQPVKTGTHIPLKSVRTGTHVPSEPVTTEIHIPSEPGGTGTHIPSESATLEVNSTTWTLNQNMQDRNAADIFSDPTWTLPHSPSEPNRTANLISVEPSEPGLRTDLHLTTGSEEDLTQTARQSSSATDIIQKSTTKRHANQRTTDIDTMYYSTTFNRGSDRTLLSVTNASVSLDITDLPAIYNTDLDSSSAKISTTGGRETIKNTGVTTRDYGITTKDSDITRDSEITTRDSVVKTRDLRVTTQNSNNTTQSSGITQHHTNTRSDSSISVPGTDPLMTPSYRIPTVSSPSDHHMLDSTIPFTSVPVTVPNTTDVFIGTQSQTNNSSVDVSSNSSSPTSSFPLNSSSFQTDSPFSTVSISASSQFTRVAFSSSPREETTLSILPATESSVANAFSSSPIPSTIHLSAQSSASLTPALSEVPPLASSTASYLSLTSTSRLPIDPSVSFSTSLLPTTYTSLPPAQGTKTSAPVTPSASTNQTADSSIAPNSLATLPITDTSHHHGPSTITESTRTFPDETASSGAVNNSSFTSTDNPLVQTMKPVDGTILTTLTDKTRTPTGIHQVSGPTVQPTVSVPPTTTSKGIFIIPQDSSHPTLGNTRSSESSVTTNDPNTLILTERTTKPHKTPSPWFDFKPSTTLHTQSRKAGIQTTTSTPRSGEYVATFATTPSIRVASPFATTASSAFSLCSLNPCQNGGFCVTDGINKSYKCVCPPAWQGQHCDTDVDECLSSPCPTQASCTNTKGSFSCRCPLGYILEKVTGCVLVRTFLGHIKVPRSFLNSSKYSELHQIEEEIVRILNMSFSSINGYYQSTVTDTRDTNHIMVSVQNVFSLASNVTSYDIISNLQNYMRLCESFPEISSGCPLILHPQLYYMAVSLCNLKNPGCDKDTAECTDLTGIAMCQCKPGYFKYSKMDHSCRACEDGFKRENGTCVRCPFGLGGFNCSNPYQLITVIIAAAGGGLLLVLGVALAVTCCRKNKNDISKLIFKSGDFQMSPYAEYPKTQRSSEWGRETIEMQENGSTKNLLQMTDVYYSPGLRNPELERNGLYPYTGLPGSRHSCIYPAQYNPSFIGEENRRRDYF
ncbi:protein HEG homolog 1 [Discoglossus pictus]